MKKRFVYGLHQRPLSQVREAWKNTAWFDQNSSAQIIEFPSSRVEKNKKNRARSSKKKLKSSAKVIEFPNNGLIRCTSKRPKSTPEEILEDWNSLE